MKNNNFKILALAFAANLIMLSLSGDRAEAAAGFPQIMTGQTTVTIGTTTYYGGLNGNFAVYNTDVNSDYGFGRDILVKSSTSCQLYTSLSIGPICFFLGSGVDGTSNPDSGSLMTGKTIIGDQVVYETPALFFSGLNVNGDVSGSLSYLLKFWGKNASRGATNTDGATWNLGSGYTFNPKSQFKWGSDKFEQYKTKLASLAAEGTKINAPTDFIGKNTFWLQQYKETGSENLFASSAPERTAGVAKYPDGQVWTIDAGGANVVIDTNTTINYKGTIIIRGGNLVVNDGVRMTNSASSAGRLGIVVLKDPTGNGGKCTFNGHNYINSMVMCEGTFKTTGNQEMVGSFVAHDFNIDTSSLATFVHDAIFDDNQPPGFRDLNLSSTTETGNR